MAWASGKSGTLCLGEQRLHLLHGEPTTPEQLQLIIEALYAEDAPSFLEGAIPGRPTPPRLATELWEAATRLAERASLKGRARWRVLPEENFHRLNAFPVRPLTARFLSRADSKKVRLGDTVRMDKSARMEVLDDFVALEVLGVVTLEAPADGAVREDPVRPRPNVDAKTERRLQREWGLLRDADDWTVLGCTPGMAPETVEAAARRMASRYRQLLRELPYLLAVHIPQRLPALRAHPSLQLFRDPAHIRIQGRLGFL